MKLKVQLLDKIKKWVTNMSVFFRAEDHSYKSVNSEDNIKWISVTSFVSKFKEKFDPIAISQKASKNKKSKWYGMTPEDIQKAWSKETDRALTLGTWYHNERESDLLSLETLTQGGEPLKIITPIIDEEGIKYAPEQKLENGIYPEHFVYLKSAGLCGQSDRVDVINGVVNIIDYKTNKEIKTEGYRNWEGISKKMLSPVAHLDDCNLNHYSLQLSFYMYIILKHNPKLKPGKMSLHHVIFQDSGTDDFGNPINKLDENNNPIVKEVVVYNIPYMKDEVITLIKHLNDNRDFLI
jgi:hypothetical protein